MPLAEITPHAVKIDRLIHRIEEGDIKIPAFQRAFIWTQEQVIELLDSIFRDYPIGSILLWNSMERLRSTRNIGGFQIPYRPDQYPVNYVLDGQQRLSSIYAVFCQDRQVALQNTEYDPDIRMFDIHFDLDDEVFLPGQDTNPDHTNLPMRVLLDNKEFHKIIKEYAPLKVDAATALQSTFQNYEIPIVTTYKRTKQEVGIIFERINSTGTSLTPLDLMVAWTWGEDFHLREQIDSILEMLETKGFGDTSEKNILQCIGAIVEKTTKTKDILSLAPHQVKSNIELLTNSLAKAVDFLSTELTIVSRDFLPHAHQLVPLTFLFSQVDTPTRNQSKLIKEWFWKTSFSRRYSGSTDKKMNEDISFFENVANDKYNGITKYIYSIDQRSLIAQQFTKGSPISRAFLLLLAQKQPLNLVNGNRIDIGSSLSTYNRKQYHHLFPRKFLKDKGIDRQKINSICNFCILPSDANKQIGSKAPSDYIFKMVPEDDFSSILESNLMPLKKEIYQKDDYDEFLKLRAQQIIQFLDKLLA